MTTRDNQVPTQFAPEASFVLPVFETVPFRGPAGTALDLLKNRLLARELERNTSPKQHVGLQRAADDAAALVWLTPYPLLLLPVLFEEKARAARLKTGRQARIRERSAELLALAE